RGGRKEYAPAPCPHRLFGSARLAGEPRLPPASDDQPRRDRAGGGAVDAARIDVPVAGGVEGMPSAHRQRSVVPPGAICTTMRRKPADSGAVLKLWNESRTNRARIADSTAVGFVHCHMWGRDLGGLQNRVTGAGTAPRLTMPIH